MGFDINTNTELVGIYHSYSMVEATSIVTFFNIFNYLLKKQVD